MVHCIQLSTPCERKTYLFLKVDRLIFLYYFTPFTQFCKSTFLIDNRACMGGAAFDDISTLTLSVQVSFLWGKVTDHYDGITAWPVRRYWETLTFSVFHTAESDAADSEDSGEGSAPKRGQSRQFISWNKQKITHQLWSLSYSDVVVMLVYTKCKYSNNSCYLFTFTRGPCAIPRSSDPAGQQEPEVARLLTAWVQCSVVSFRVAEVSVIRPGQRGVLRDWGHKHRQI